MDIERRVAFNLWWRRPFYEMAFLRVWRAHRRSAVSVRHQPGTVMRDPRASTSQPATPAAHHRAAIVGNARWAADFINANNIHGHLLLLTPAYRGGQQALAVLDGRSLDHVLRIGACHRRARPRFGGRAQFRRLPLVSPADACSIALLRKPLAPGTATFTLLLLVGRTSCFTAASRHMPPYRPWSRPS